MRLKYNLKLSHVTRHSAICKHCAAAFSLCATIGFSRKTDITSTH